MISIPLINDQEKNTLKEFHEDYGRLVLRASCSAAAASFLLIGALIVITCACLCLALPGVNVINDVILRGVVPGVLTIGLSLPLILLAVKFNLDKNFIRKQMITQMVTLLDHHKMPEQTRKIRIKFLLKNFLNWPSNPHEPQKLLKNVSWSDEYQNQILTDIKDAFGSDKKAFNPRQKKIAMAVDKACAKIPGKPYKD